MSAGLVNGHGICVAELGMHRVNPEHLDPEPFSDLATTDFLFREEPDEEEETRTTETGVMAMLLRKARATRSEDRRCPTFTLSRTVEKNEIGRACEPPDAHCVSHSSGSDSSPVDFNCTIPFDENGIFVAPSQPSGERASLAAVSGRIVFFQKSDGKTLSPNSRVLVRRCKGSVACKSSNI